MCVCVFVCFNTCEMIKSSQEKAGEQARARLTEECDVKSGWREQKMPL